MACARKLRAVAAGAESIKTVEQCRGTSVCGESESVESEVAAGGLRVPHAHVYAPLRGRRHGARLGYVACLLKDFLVSKQGAGT